jgi:hypothetical protein
MAAFLAPLLLLSPSAEASPLCDRLFARLADMPETRFTEPVPGDFTGAISRQNIELRRARSEQRSLGCSSGSVTIVNGENEEACADLDNRIAAIVEDLDALKARRIETIAGSQDDAARRRVLVALQTNRCQEVDSDIVSASVSPDPLDGPLDGQLDRPLVDRTYGDPSADPLDEPPVRRHRNIIANLPPIGSEETVLRGGSDPEAIAPDISAPNLHLLTQEGPLRTMCVRTCDGSFFPISANAGPADFDRDADACSARCPGAQTELYYHPLTSETSEMVSASTGRPYTELPTAFAYKSGSPASRSQCGCRLPPQSASTGAASPAPMSQPVANPASEKSVVSITTRPQTEATAPTVPAQNLNVAAPPAVERPYDPKAKRVRQVGPAFLPTEESAIDLHHPDGPDTQPQQTN